MNKSYKELIQLKTFEERYNYLQINGRLPSEVIFGGHRLLNQMLYQSSTWKRVRREVIIRDNGCDLGMNDRPIMSKIIIHHINPITIEDVSNNNPIVFDLNNLICCSHDTHNGIHYGSNNIIPSSPIERKRGDTLLW